VLAGWTAGLLWATFSDARREWRTFLNTQVLDREEPVRVIGKWAAWNRVYSRKEADRGRKGQ
jgi:hypothetical protein